MEKLTNTDYEMFRERWYQNINNGKVFYFLKHALFNVKHLPDSGFKDVFEQLNAQMKKLIKHEFNENISKYPGKETYKEIGELYKSDFEMVYRLTKYLGKTWPDLYTEEIVNKIDEYVKYYEKYIFKMF